MLQTQGAPLKSSENQTQKIRSELAVAEEEGKSGGESAEEKARRREEKKGEKERRLLSSFFLPFLLFSPPRFLLRSFPPPPQSLTHSVLPSSLLLRRCYARLMCLTGRGRVEHALCLVFATF